MNAQMSALTARLAEVWGSIAGRFAATGAASITSRQVLIGALAFAGLLVLVLAVAVLLMPAKRKVVRKRRVRVIRREVTATTQPDLAEEDGGADDVDSVQEGLRRRAGSVVWGLTWAIVTAAVIAGTYAVTSTNWYCAQSCHGADVHVAVADEARHAGCVDCHEADPFSGSASRIRMVVSYKQVANAAEKFVLVDPARCLRCHRATMQKTVMATARLRVSHKEILAGGRTCGDCHISVGHNVRRSFAGTMAQCLACHDGRRASRECEECHRGGSPLAARVKKSTSTFDYPAVRVANRDCTRCHGVDRKCLDCHNGLQLPHPQAFVRGGHARLAAFSGKERCFKCHPIMWCGDGRCHEAFSAHDERTWRTGHQSGTSARCGSCHLAWNGKTDFCKTCH